MGIKVYYSEICGQKEIKKRQQRVMMILDSKNIEYEAIDITEPGQEEHKEFVQKNAKAKGNDKIPLSPQIFDGEDYCGDYDGFDLANENDELEVFLKMPIPDKNANDIVNNASTPEVNGRPSSREASAEAESVKNIEDAQDINDNNTEKENGEIVKDADNDPEDAGENIEQKDSAGEDEEE